MTSRQSGDKPSRDAATSEPDHDAPAKPDMYRLFFEFAPDAVVVVDRDGRIVRVNPRTESLFVYRSEELVGQAVEVLVPRRLQGQHAKDRERFQVSPGHRPMGVGLELYGRRKDGSEFPVDVMLAPARNADQDLVIAVVRDITERHRLLTELLENIRQRHALEQMLRQSQSGHVWRALFRTMGRGASAILYQAGLEAGSSAHEYVRGTWKPTNLQEFLQALKDYFELSGLCEISEISVDRPGSTLVARVTGSVETRVELGEAPGPTCHYLRGQFCGLASKLIDAPDLRAEETACQAKGAEACEFVIRPLFGPEEGPR